MAEAYRAICYMLMWIVKDGQAAPRDRIDAAQMLRELLCRGRL
jgi:hypothetical protein